MQVEILWEVSHQELAFRSEDSWFRALYEVSLVLSRDGTPVVGEIWERRVRARTASEAASPDEVSRGRRRVTVAPGVYEVRLSLADRRARTTARIEGEVDAFSDGIRIGLSQPRFVRYTEEGVLPNPANEVRIGEEGHRVRITIHPHETVEGPVEMSWRLEDAGRVRITSRDTTVTLAGKPVTVEFAIPSDRLSAGDHRLRFRVTDLHGGGGATRTTSLTGRLTPRWFLTHREEALDVFRALGPREDVRRLEKANDREWPGAVENFWSRRDPSPALPGNDYVATILTRMESAATRFREPFLRPGWKTDRGRVLLKHGEPARKASGGGGFDGPARELWEYDSPSRRFLFVDERGSGEYWLRN